MKFMRFGNREAAKTACLVEPDGTLRDLSSLVSDIGPDTLGGQLHDALKDADVSQLKVINADGRRIAPPMAQPNNIWCVGLNYSDHAAEAGLPVPGEPILFNKASGTFCGPNDPLLFSPEMTKLDWEVELGIVISKPALRVSKESAMDHVAGFVLVNDVSERAWQMEREGQWVKGKSFPNFCPVGPILVTPDEVDVGNLGMWLDIDGERMQDGSTSTMIFDVPTVVSYMSEFTRLEAGDLICTGTPPGVGAGMDPQRWLKPGEVVTLGIDGLGEQRQEVTAL
ncbi:fumarylacetoacetate hydrolase family protein [Erythrobacter sp. W53]|uniref:fumarylacetoacetate hydrolase family protein n=1 Tax=Erythrobacter sp. W53 TaxID=3425947 RepID=UPI003D768286